MAAGLCSAKPATASTTKSAPSCAGLSITILSPVLTPGPTAITLHPVTFLSAVFTLSVISGTTEAVIAPVISVGFILCISRISLSSTTYSIEVRLIPDEIFSTKRISSPLQQPALIYVFPISTAKIILNS